jgi:hypothetical protein
MQRRQLPLAGLKDRGWIDADFCGKLVLDAPP